jgi:hypothetical protein
MKAVRSSEHEGSMQMQGARRHRAGRTSKFHSVTLAPSVGPTETSYWLLSLRQTRYENGRVPVALYKAATTEGNTSRLTSGTSPILAWNQENLDSIVGVVGEIKPGASKIEDSVTTLSISELQSVCRSISLGLTPTRNLFCKICSLKLSWRVSWLLRFVPTPQTGARGSVVVKALCYKLEGRGFDSR